MEHRGIFCTSFPEKQKSTGFSNCDETFFDIATFKPGVFEKLMKSWRG